MSETSVDHLFTPEALSLLREMAQTHGLAPVVVQFMATSGAGAGGSIPADGLFTADEVREAFRDLLDMGFVQGSAELVDKHGEERS